jgi:hypothetical protein
LVHPLQYSLSYSIPILFDLGSYPNNYPQKCPN